ncbi:MAG TPA: dTDP-4-dehydrorhamnose reductase, partial [Spirochaetales bacterium]|nr:dTDP-4-dehydrorhamnose reductase [Spirochaetales bacterium]
SILDPAALEAFAAGKGIVCIVNCAAYTAVDKAETEEDLARKLNADGPENIGRLAANLGARVVHVSTDYVFDGNGKSPYKEGDPVNPASAYGRTKAEGEARLLAACPSAMIVRTAWLYGRYGPNFVATMLRLMAEKDELGVVMDQRGSPTWAYDLAVALADLAVAEDVPSGPYHFTNDGETSWYDFAVEIQRLGRELGVLSRDCRVKPLTTAEYGSKTRRPAYSVLSKERIKALGVPVPGWKESLRAYFTRDLI